MARKSQDIFNTFEDKIEEPMVEEKKEEPIVEPEGDTIITIEDKVLIPEPVVEVEPEEKPWPRKYVCKTRCWVASKINLFNPGDIVEFSEGENIPSHFVEM